MPLQPLELGAVCLVALLVGPLSWEHYFVWAFVPFVLCFDLEPLGRSEPTRGGAAHRRTRGRDVSARVPLQTLWSMTDVVAWRVVITGPATIAALLYLAVVGVRSAVAHTADTTTSRRDVDAVHVAG